MTNDEATDTWNALSANLTKSGLDEILRRVEAYLAEGKPEEREIEVFEEYSGADGKLATVQDWRRRPGPRSRYLAHIEYTQQERVHILAEAILHWIVFSRQMEHDVWSYLEKSAGDRPDILNIESIRLTHEDQNKNRPIWSLQRQLPMAELRRLQELLEQLSKAAQE